MMMDAILINRVNRRRLYEFKSGRCVYSTIRLYG